jgi:hypothetical protein
MHLRELIIGSALTGLKHSFFVARSQIHMLFFAAFRKFPGNVNVNRLGTHI